MDPKRLEHLSAAYVEGTLDEAAAAELLQLAEADPEIRRDLVAQVRTDRLLRASRSVDADPVIHAIASRRANFSTRVIARIPRRPAPGIWPWIVSLAAVALIAAALLATRRPAPAPALVKPPAPEPAPVVKAPEPPPVAEPEPPKGPAPLVVPPPVPVPVPAPVPGPGPAPEPKPAPPPPSTPAPTPTVVEKAVAALEGGRDLLEGEIVAGPAAVRWPDGSRVELSHGGQIRAAGARVERGTVNASVTKVAGRVFAISTPAAEVVVLGTRFMLKVDASSTVLEVQEGKVRLKRADGMAVDVAAGLTATAAKGVALAAKPMLRTLVFQDGVSPDASYAGTRDTTLSQLAPSENRGGDAQLSIYRPVEGMETSVLRWDVAAIPAGSRVVSAELTLYVTGMLTAPGWRIHELRRPWDERAATWKAPWQIPGAQGDADRGRLAAVFAPTSTGAITVPLSEAVVQQWINGANFGLVFVPAGSSAKWGLESRETARPDRRPRLSVTFIPPIR